QGDQAGRAKEAFNPPALNCPPVSTGSLLRSPLKPNHVFGGHIEAMPLWAGHLHSSHAGLLTLNLDIALTAQGVVCVRGHLAALGAFRSPIPITGLPNCHLVILRLAGSRAHFFFFTECRLETP